MLIDYLRYTAFRGNLRSFFSGGLVNYVDLEHTTGQHLRYSPKKMDELWGSYFPYWRWGNHHERVVDEVRKIQGLYGGKDDMSLQSFEVGAVPPVQDYEASRPQYLEIIIDIDPQHWSERYTEQPAYEGVPIIYRKAGIATAYLASGDRLYDSARLREPGTLCGVFRKSTGEEFGLTCGHVAVERSTVLAEQVYSLWGIPVWRRRAYLGETAHQTLLGPLVGGAVRNQREIRTRLDAALVRIERQRFDPMRTLKPAPFQPISTLLQEWPVAFRGSGRLTQTPGRIAAVTIIKSMKVPNDPTLHEIGDVLMIGHRQRMYTARWVGGPGDSGAAVQHGILPDGDHDDSRWHGMIIGGDDTGAFATYSEYLWGWASQMLRDPQLEFLYEA
jgi:hypothetical protein